jgi:hypothetical protein
MIEYIKSLTVGEVVIIVIAIAEVCSFVYKYWNKTYNLKKNNEDFHEEVEKLKQEVEVLKQKIVSEDKEIIDLKSFLQLYTRHELTETCNKYLEKGSIDSHSLQAIIELYNFYHDKLHGNSYVTALVNKVKELEIRDV